MRIRWTSKARSDLARVYDFLAPVNRPAAARVVQSLRAAPARLLRHYPRLGARVEGFAPREIRRLFVGDYEPATKIQEDMILVVRIWHAREDR
jgi:plasmid stabilization system protein ParE